MGYAIVGRRPALLGEDRHLPGGFWAVRLGNVVRPQALLCGLCEPRGCEAAALRQRLQHQRRGQERARDGAPGRHLLRGVPAPSRRGGAAAAPQGREEEGEGGGGEQAPRGSSV